MTAQKYALVVDDNEVNRLLAERLLAKLGWRVDTAEDGLAALAWLRGHCADLVLLDISMPGMSGDEVCRTARAEGLCQGSKLVAYTAHAMPEEKTQFLAAGFDGILTKPISKTHIAEMLASLGLDQ